MFSNPALQPLVSRRLPEITEGSSQRLVSFPGHIPAYTATINLSEGVVRLVEDGTYRSCFEMKVNGVAVKPRDEQNSQVVTACAVHRSALVELQGRDLPRFVQYWTRIVPAHKPLLQPILAEGADLMPATTCTFDGYLPTPPELRLSFWENELELEEQFLPGQVLESRYELRVNGAAIKPYEPQHRYPATQQSLPLSEAQTKIEACIRIESNALFELHDRKEQKLIWWGRAIYAGKPDEAAGCLQFAVAGLPKAPQLIASPTPGPEKEHAQRVIRSAEVLFSLQNLERSVHLYLELQAKEPAACHEDSQGQVALAARDVFMSCVDYYGWDPKRLDPKVITFLRSALIAARDALPDGMYRGSIDDKVELLRLTLTLGLEEALDRRIGDGGRSERV